MVTTIDDFLVCCQDQTLTSQMVANFFLERQSKRFDRQTLDAFFLVLSSFVCVILSLLEFQVCLALHVFLILNNLQNQFHCLRLTYRQQQQRQQILKMSMKVATSHSGENVSFLNISSGIVTVEISLIRYPKILRIYKTYKNALDLQIRTFWYTHTCLKE